MIITGKKFSKPAMSRVINGDVELKSPQEKPEKRRLDLLLLEKYPDYNRSTLQFFIKSGYVSADDKIIKKPNTLLDPAATITLALPETPTKKPDIPVIYEDGNVLVLDKPAGLLSMKKGEYTSEPTLEDYGLLVHRLDRDTSGVIILAKNPAAKTFLQKQFQERKAKKTYLAITSGIPNHPEAIIDLPIARNLKRPTTFRVDPSGRPAKTHYQVLKSGQHHALLELHPETGRTHQLRVHLAHLGTPIVGDSVYGDGQPTDRLLLHAHRLELTLPGVDRRTFTSPLPKEFKDHVL